MLTEILTALEETLFMVFSAGILTWCIGLPRGVLLAQKSQNVIFIYFCHIITFILNGLNSVPNLILMIALIPFSIGLFKIERNCMAAIFPLVLASIPFFAKRVAAALENVPKGIIELGISVGATRWQIIYKILIPEAFTQILTGFMSTLVKLLEHAVIAGALGCGGIGLLAVQKGYSQKALDVDYIIILVIVTIVMTQLLQRFSKFIHSGALLSKSIS